MRATARMRSWLPYFTFAGCSHFARMLPSEMFNRTANTPAVPHQKHPRNGNATSQSHHRRVERCSPAADGRDDGAFIGGEEDTVILHEVVIHRDAGTHQQRSRQRKLLADFTPQVGRPSRRRAVRLPPCRFRLIRSSRRRVLRGIVMLITHEAAERAAEAAVRVRAADRKHTRDTAPGGACASQYLLAFASGTRCTPSSRTAPAGGSAPRTSRHRRRSRCRSSSLCRPQVPAIPEQPASIVCTCTPGMSVNSCVRSASARAAPSGGTGRGGRA